jgi:O-antigen ligase
MRAAALPIAVLALLSVFLALTQFPQILSRLKILGQRLRWWHLLWLLMFISGLVFRVRDIESIYANPLDFWALFRVGLMAIVALTLLGQLALRADNWIRALFLGTIGLLSIHSLAAILSTVWSAYPSWTLYRSLEYFVDVWLAAATVTAIRSEQDLRAVFDWAWIMVAALIASVWAGLVLFPGQAIIPGVGILGVQIQGVIPSIAANGVGELGALLAIMALTRMLFATSIKRTYLFLFLAGAITLVLSQSRSPLMGFLLALPLVLFTSRRIGLVVLLVLLLPAALFFTGLGDLFWKFFLRGQNQELLLQLSGRRYWWESSLGLLRDHPLTGFGAYAGGRFIALAALDVTLSSTIHNTWLEVLLGTGLIGLLTLLAAFIWIWVVLLGREPKSAEDSFRRRLHAEVVGIMAILSVRSIFTSTLIWHAPLMFLLVLVYVESSRHALRGS